MEFRIFTITLNPSLDRFVWDYRDKRQKDRRKYVEVAGGKGICVSRALANLGIDNTAIAFYGCNTGERLLGKINEHTLNSLGVITPEFIKIKGCTRQNVIYNYLDSKKQVIYKFEGPKIEDDEKQSLTDTISKISTNNICQTIAVIGGSLPDKLDPDYMNDMINNLKKNGIIIILDASGDALRSGVKSQPHVIKPNFKEVKSIWGSRLKSGSNRDLAKLAQWIQSEYCIEIVLISIGPRGIILVTKDQELIGIPPSLKKLPLSPNLEIRNNVGAGDSSIAGFIYGWKNQNVNFSDLDLPKQLKYSVAAGTATTLLEEPTLCNKDDFDKLIGKVIIKDPITGKEIYSVN
ncbi:MAG TPA: PfkB family carbohydrate kinase [Bacteroidales bacterium]|nr:PfkB family carbohydrate kinase [Bacteroidales bacterium]